MWFKSYEHIFIKWEWTITVHTQGSCNLILAQYLRNIMIELDQNLHNVLIEQDLGHFRETFSLIQWPKGVARPRSAVGNVSGYRCVSDCRSRGREFDPGPVPYFRGLIMKWFLRSFSSFRWFIQEGLLSVTSESMCTNYWLTACSSLPRKKCG